MTIEWLVLGEPAGRVGQYLNPNIFAYLSMYILMNILIFEVFLCFLLNLNTMYLYTLNGEK